MRKISIYIDDKIFRLPEIYNGAGLLAAVGKDGTQHLYQEAANPHAFDLPIGVLDRVILRKGMSFYTIPPSGPHGASPENDAALRAKALPKFKPKLRKIIRAKAAA